LEFTTIHRCIELLGSRFSLGKSKPESTGNLAFQMSSFFYPFIGNIQTIYAGYLWLVNYNLD
jgi:hypothetical protein